MEQISWMPGLRKKIRGVVSKREQQKEPEPNKDLKITRKRSDAKRQSLPPSNPSQGSQEASHPPVATTREDLARTADAQALSNFFVRLPLEVRQLIYLEVWRAYIPSLRLHIYAAGIGCCPLQHVPCVVAHDDKPEGDTKALQPWGLFPDDLPHSIYRAWCLRLRWERHWKCQERVMSRWDPRKKFLDKIPEEPGLLQPFLVCKRMHFEAMASFFSNVSLIFTSSEDAHRFFDQPPAWLDHIRTLEFSFGHLDHLYLRNGEFRSSAPVGLRMWKSLVATISPPKTNLRSLRVIFHSEQRRSDAYRDYLALLETDAWSLPGGIELEFTQVGKKYRRIGDGELGEVERWKSR